LVAPITFTACSKPEKILQRTIMQPRPPAEQHRCRRHIGAAPAASDLFRWHQDYLCSNEKACLQPDKMCSVA
jgi:hypothetical protein